MDYGWIGIYEDLALAIPLIWVENLTLSEIILFFCNTTLSDREIHGYWNILITISF